MALGASKLAGLHVHFFLKTRELARAGDFGAFGHVGGVDGQGAFYPGWHPSRYNEFQHSCM